jgi:hypothetical protein
MYRIFIPNQSKERNGESLFPDSDLCEKKVTGREGSHGMTVATLSWQAQLLHQRNETQ